MKFFDLFKKEQARQELTVAPPEGQEVDRIDAVVPEKTVEPERAAEIPEHVFVEYAHPSKKNRMEEQNEVPAIFDLETLYKFLDQNLEKKGYEDALVNPDTSYMEEHIRLLQNELELLVSRIQSDYRSHANKIDFHIETRKRSGMIETVEELLAHKKTTDEEALLVNSIYEASKRGEGISQNMVLSYKRGFRNGFAAITFNTILNRKK
jgi:hypothetical protein